MQEGNYMRSLLSITALIELGAGLALLGFPVDSDQTPGRRIDRRSGRIDRGANRRRGVVVAGHCLLVRRNDSRSGAAKGLVAAMLLYNAAVVAILLFAALGLRLHGILLWPGVVLHTLMAVGCVACLAQSAGRTAGSPQTGTSKSSTRNKE